MKQHFGIVIVGLIEISIGLITLVAVITSLISGKSTKPLEVVIFVLTTSAISLGLGIGILRYNLHSYHLLLFFAAVIVLSKILIFARIITLNGALETTVPAHFKNLTSIVYHTVLLWYLAHPSLRKQVRERRGNE